MFLVLVFGLIYGGILISVWLWWVIFVGIVLLLVLLVILGVFNILGKVLGVGDKKFDYLGVIFLVIIFISLLFMFNNVGIYGWLLLNFGFWCLWSIVMIGVMVMYVIKGCC